MGFGRTLILLGAVLLIAGLLISLLSRFTAAGRLPGDIVYRRGNFTFYFPVVTSIILSLLLTGIMWLLNRR
ncbi:MAG TPA: DUF2905 domain-containing protein [Bryobacteraceae bacterium]|nr:DUF2905 domain-containing protein [Bryobacteraceae bacterium]